MSKLLFKKTPMGLQPQGDDSVTVFNSIKMDEEVLIDYKRHRNVKHHRKYFALLNAVIHNQKHFKTVENLHEAIKYRAGHYETMFMLDGAEIIKTKSIAFSKMDEREYTVFYGSALDVCMELISEESVNDILKFL